YNQETSFEDLRDNLNLSNKIGKRHTNLMLAFCDTNIRNIYYYEKKIKNENNWRDAYSVLSILLVIGIPIAIFVFTDSTAKNIEIGGIQILRSTESMIIALSAAVLGFHKVISSWIEKRKFRAQFLQAKVDLMNITYNLVEDHRWIDDDQVKNDKDHHYVTEELQDALTKGIKDSRSVVDKEAKNYFELSANPAFDLASTLSNATTTAASLFNGLKSKRFEAEMRYLEEEEKEQRTAEKERKKEEAKNELDYHLLSRKLIRLSAKEAELNEKYVPLQLKEIKNEQDKKEIDEIKEQLALLEAEVEPIEEKLEELEIKMQLHALS
ncbi:MAG: hypothetical protein RLP15_12310, partial [Cryomorphaceae bacterium]